MKYVIANWGGNFWEIKPNEYTIMSWIDLLTKTSPKPLLVSLNPNPNKPLILVKSKVLIKPE